MHRLINIIPTLRLIIIVCSAVCLSVPVSPARPAESYRVAIVASSTRVEYQQASQIIASELQQANPGIVAQKQIFDSGNGREEEFWQRLAQSNPDLVVTIGTEATQSAKRYISNTPVVFSMVLDNYGSRLGEGDSRDFNGVTLAIPIDKQFEYINKVLPQARRVGFIYGSKMEETYKMAVAAAKKQNIRLFSEKIASERDIPEALRRILPVIDAYWMPLDPMFFEEIVFRFMLPECFKNSVPIVSVYRHVVQAGIPLALGVDYEDISRQTAQIALRRLNGGRFASPVVDHPRKLVLYVNEAVASSLNIRIPAELNGQVIPVRSGS